MTAASFWSRRKLPTDIPCNKGGYVSMTRITCSRTIFKWEADPNLMSRTNANSTSLMTQLKALGRCVSAVGRNLCNRVLRTASSVMVSRKRNRLYFLYTEHTGKTGLHNIQAALDPRFPGYTIDLKALGRYEGQSENSAIIHVLTHDRDAVRNAAAEICEKNKQQTVLCIELPITLAEFVTAKAKSNSNRTKRPGTTRSRKTRTARTSRKRAIAAPLKSAPFAAGRNRL